MIKRFQFEFIKLAQKEKEKVKGKGIPFPTVFDRGKGIAGSAILSKRKGKGIPFPSTSSRNVSKDSLGFFQRKRNSFSISKEKEFLFLFCPRKPRKPKEKETMRRIGSRSGKCLPSSGHEHFVFSSK